VQFGQPAHARQQDLRVAGDEFGLAADLGKHPLEGAVIQREHPVTGGLDEEEPPQLVQLVRVLLG
jgi:hypothetical protein